MPVLSDFTLEENVPLSKFTTWKIGGLARYFANAKTSNLPNIVKFANANNLKFVILGAGSNVLIPSEGLDCLVIRYFDPKAEFLFGDNSIEVSASLSLPMLVRVAASKGFSDLNFLAGIPGSVGGGIFMNAGIGGENKMEISQCLDSASIIDRFGNLKEVSSGYFNFSYRYSSIQFSRDIVLSAKFKLLKKTNPQDAADEIISIVKSRRLKEPENRKNCGSVFKACRGVPAGILIDKAGLKGLRVNGAMVSFKHANWIENLGGASSDDVLNLIAKIKKIVFEKFGEKLEEEVRILSC